MSINYNGTIKSLRDIVWGVVTDPLSQIEQITLLIFIKLLSERHNELQRLKAKKLIFTGEFSSYHFDSISRLTGNELVDTTRKAIESLYKNPDIDEPIRRLYERSYLQVNDPRVLSLLINEINKIDITHIDMGDFYEHLLSVLGTQKEAGQFRTPRHLIEFIVNIVDPQISERVLDPACGTAGFLTSAYTHIRDANTSQEARKTDAYLDKLNFDQKTFLLNKTIFGFDIDPKMIKFAISNLYLHNIKNPNISQHNTLTSNDSWEEKYDVILTNPPFSTPKGGVKPTDRYTLDSKRTEVLFAEYVIEHLTLNGRAGVIVPEGIIFQSGKAYKELRKWLVENNYLYAVVSLPSGVFNPYSGVKTSILFLDRGRTQLTDKILFCQVENDGFDLGAQRKPINKNDLPEILQVIKEYKKNQEIVIDSKNAQVVDKEKIVKSGDYSLLVERYRESTQFLLHKWPIVELREVCEIYNGSTPSRSRKDYWEGGNIPWFTIDDIRFQGRVISQTSQKITEKALKESSVKLLPKKTILLCCTASVGEYAITTIQLTTNQQFNGLIVKSNYKDKLLPKFLFWMASNFKEELIRLSGKTSFNFVSVGTLKKIKIPLPPLSVQQQIVDELDGYQNIIDGAKQVVDNYKPSFKIDPKWKVVELSELVNLQNGYAFRSQDYIEKSNTLNFRMSNIKPDGGVDISYNQKFLPDSYYEKYKDYALYDGDVVIAMTDMASDPKILGVPTIVNSMGKKLLLNQRVGKFKDLKTDRLFIPFLKYALQRDEVKQYYKKLGGGGLQLNISKNQILSIQIPLPPLEAQKQIVAKIEEEQKLVEANKKLIQLFEQKIKDKIEEVWRA